MFEDKYFTFNDDLATMIRLFGPPPLQSSETFEHFEEMMSKLTECLQPEDFVVSLLVYQLGIETWSFIRCRRYEALILDRWNGVEKTLAAQMAKIQEQRNEQAKEAPELLQGSSNEAARYIALSPLWDRVDDDLKLIEGRTNEIKLAGAFERGVRALQEVNLLANDYLKRRNDALRQIEWYRVALAHDLRKATDAIIQEDYVPLEASTDENEIQQPAGRDR